MDNQKCAQCGAPMKHIANRDGTDTFVCEYCGASQHVSPKSVSDKLFSFANRAVNAYAERKKRPKAVISFGNDSDDK